MPITAAARLDGGGSQHINVIETSSPYHMVCAALVLDGIMRPRRMD
jgi:hypothetical protein